MGSLIPPLLEAWLRAPQHTEVEARWVPGLDASERRALQAVGGVARELLTESQVSTLPADVRTWMQNGLTPPADALLELRDGLDANPDATLASLYATIVRSDHRRQLGTFFTPSAEVKLMLDLWSETEGSVPSTVVDVGAGVGVFTAEAAKRWPEAHVVAVDINPVTLGLLAVRLLSDAVTPDWESRTNRVELVCEDYTTWITSKAAPGSGNRLILGNPPYTRAQLLSARERTRLNELANGLCGSRASLSTLITAITLGELGPTDGMSLLLPAQWLESQYAKKLRAEIWKSRRRRVELRLVESEDLFGGAQVDAVALLVGREETAPQQFRVARWREKSSNTLERSGDEPETWRAVFDQTLTTARDKNSSATIALSDIATIHRGVATGANATFVLSSKEARGLPKKALTRVITRLYELPDEVTPETLATAPTRSVSWLLSITDSMVKRSPRLQSLIEQAEEEDIHKRVLCSRRADWFDLTTEIHRPDVIIGAMTQGRFRLVSNEAGATITNNLYGISWKDNFRAAQRPKVIEWLRSPAGQTALTEVARRQGAGLLKLEPGGLKALRLPVRIVGKLQETADGTPGKKALEGNRI